MKIGNIETFTINGFECLTVRDFATMVNRSESSVRRLITYGNRFRKIRKITIDGKSFIPLIELEKYPFTYQGRTGTSSPVVSYRYNKEGVIKVIIGEWFCGATSVKRCDKDCASCEFGIHIDQTDIKEHLSDERS